MPFGLDRVGPRLYFLACLMAALGAVISAFWILAANSWMQTPAGFTEVDGRFQIASWWAAIFNPSFLYRQVVVVCVTGDLESPGWHFHA